jgi:hypothetical protein
MRILFALLLWPALAAAGPWTRDAGQAYVKLSSGVYWADAFAGSDGAVVDGVAYQGLSQTVYAEVGLAKNVQLLLYLPHQTATNDFEGYGRFRSAALGDAKLGVQVGLPLPFPVALRTEMKIPLYDAAEPSGAQRASFPLLGDGQMDVNLWVSAGGSIPGLPMYGFVEVGHQVRTDAAFGEGLNRSFGDGLLGAAQLGIDVYGGVILAANANAVLPYADEPGTKAYVTAGPSIYAPFWRGLAFEAAFDTTPWARYSARGMALSLGLSWNHR